MKKLCEICDVQGEDLKYTKQYRLKRQVGPSRYKKLCTSSVIKKILVQFFWSFKTNKSQIWMKFSTILNIFVFLFKKGIILFQWTSI